MSVAACTLLGMHEELLSGPEWMDLGQCTVVPEPFLEPGREAEAVEQCLLCPVLATCQAYGEEQNERWGVWGGLVRGPVR